MVPVKLMSTYLLIICVSSLISAASGSSTVVVLTDNELLPLLQTLIFSQIAGNAIPYSLLVANGLNTQSVINLLIRLGYFIF